MSVRRHENGTVCNRDWRLAKLQKISLADVPADLAFKDGTVTAAATATWNS
jgi:hypothetical protein